MTTTTNKKAQETEEVNFQDLFATLCRQWPIVIGGIVFGGITSALITSRTTPQWEGGFEAVIRSANQGGSLSNLQGMGIMPMLSSLGSGTQSALQNEVKILASPSVLLPVFEQAKAIKSSLGEDVKNFSFNNFRKSLSVNLHQGTSILSVQYRDQNKKSIIPVLRKLADAYQDYSTLDQRMSTARSIKYAEAQSTEYKKRAEESFRAMNSFGQAYGIASRSPGALADEFDVSRLSSPASSSTFSRLGSSRKDMSSPQSNGNPAGRLADINKQLIQLEQTFTPNYPDIISLKRERDALRSYIDSSAFGIVANTGNQKLTKAQAQSVVLRYQELQRKADLDMSILSSMENTLVNLRLEQARATTPWRIISSPFVTNDPVTPQPLRNIAIGLGLGTLFGSASALLAERRSGEIFDKDKLQELLALRLILELPTHQQNTWDQSLRLLALNTNKEASIGILPLGRGIHNEVSMISNILKNTCGMNIEVCRTTLEASTFDTQLLVAAPGSIKRTQLSRLRQELEIQKAPALGWIWLDTSRTNG